VRVVHVYKDYHPPVRGGIEQTVERMARSQASAGHEVTVLTSASGARHSIVEHLHGVRVIRVAEWGRALSAPFCPAMPWQLSRLTADIIHLHAPNPTGELSWLMAHPTCPMVVTYHSDIVRQKAFLPLYGPFLHAVLRRARVIMPTSSQYVDRSEFLKPYRDKCLVVPLGVEMESFDDIERARSRALELRRLHGTPVVLFVGRFRAYKGIDVLIRSMRDVPATLVLVGDGPEEGRLRSLVGEVNAKARVVFTGPVDDAELLAWLAAADVGVLPSTLPSEALGMVLIEMLACGVPAVSTELGTGTSFVNRHGETGLVVPPSDPEALSAALNQLLADEPLRRRMGSQGRARARELFSRDSMMLGVSKAYERAMSGDGARGW